MTDHRATDLSYGHLGEASYDLDEHSWYFSHNITPRHSIQPLHPMQQCTPPTLRYFPGSTKTTSKVHRAQKRWLQKMLPEAGPASSTILSMQRTLGSTQFALHPSTSLALGRAIILGNVSEARTMEVMAMVHGEAGNSLRLIRPRIEALEWDDQDRTKLRALNPITPEDCYWLGDGGAIQQIAFGHDRDGGLTSWLAVLKAESTSILRPIYRQDETPSTMPTDLGVRYPPSRLSPNPILRIGSERTGGRPHADVSFNPWHIRQFAIIDQQGYWSVWDIEGQKRKRTTFEAKPGRSGHIQDDLSDQGFETHQSADGWGRVLWAGGFSTLILCDRRNFAVFDVKATPKRLHSPLIIQPESADLILDMKRSTVNLHDIFVLTTSQVFWLRITEAGEDQNEQYVLGGAHILLSCQHFRNKEDETAKLELLKENEDCFILLYSARSVVVNTYRFGTPSGESTALIYSQGSFIIELSNEDQGETPPGMIQTMCLLPATFVPPILNLISGPAKEYAGCDVHFYQLFGLSVAFGLSHTLCATMRTAPRKSEAEPIKYPMTLAPNIKYKRKGKVKSSRRVIEDQFVVPDGLKEGDEDIESFNVSSITWHQSKCLVRHRRKAMEAGSSSIDARRLFEVSFLEREFEGPNGFASPIKPSNMTNYLQSIHLGLQEWKKQGLQGLMTLFDFAGHISFSEDIDETASTLRELIDALSSHDEATDASTITPLAIRPSPLIGSNFIAESNDATPDLSDVYDKLVDLWVSCLPRKIPGHARLAKERLVRSVAIELYLSSLAISIRDKTVARAKPEEFQGGIDFVLPVRTKPDLFEQMDGNSAQTPASVPLSSLLTPAATPSLRSKDSTNPLGDGLEDGAISRLRGYVLSINSQPPLGASRLAVLSHWPSAPGVDPSKYSWEASCEVVPEGEMLDSDEEGVLIRQREQDRRHRRTERFLKKQRVNTINTVSQPLPTLSFGSQPDLVQHAPNSQTADVSMTQPERGIFGSRLGLRGPKKRRTVGF